LIWNVASQANDQLFGFITRLVTVLPSTIPQDLKCGMIATLPMKLEIESIRIWCNDNLFQHCA